MTAQRQVRAVLTVAAPTPERSTPNNVGASLPLNICYGTSAGCALRLRFTMSRAASASGQAARISALSRRTGCARSMTATNQHVGQHWRRALPARPEDALADLRLRRPPRQGLSVPRAHVQMRKRIIMRQLFTAKATPSRPSSPAAATRAAYLGARLLGEFEAPRSRRSRPHPCLRNDAHRKTCSAAADDVAGVGGGWRLMADRALRTGKSSMMPRRPASASAQGRRYLPPARS